MRVAVIGSIVVLAALTGAAAAQTPSPFDGTYRVVSSAKVTETYTAKGGQSGPCPDRTPGPLTIAQGQARYLSETGLQVAGTVGPQGQLTMRAQAPGASRPVEVEVNGQVNAAGTARARQLGFSCSYDFVWQK